MRDIEQKISPLVQSMFPSFYKEEGPNFIAFVQAYYEWLETNFQLLQLEDPTNFNVGDIVTQEDVTGTIINYVGSNILVQIDGFNTFKCYNVCSDLIPITSSSGGSTFILAGGNTRRLSPLYMSRNLTKLRDIDKTLDLFVVNFKEKYLKNIEFDISTNKQLLVKNSLDLYRSKGTERSIDLFFRLVYGIKADVEYPGERLFTLSAGQWYSPSYIEITSESVNRNIELVGKQIEGVESGATAFVEKYVKRKISTGFVHLLYISNIKGSFQKNELIKSDFVYSDSPKILGSLTAVNITSGGANYRIGDTVQLVSDTGDKALARVSSIRDKTGTVDFELISGGWGYTVSSNSSSNSTTQTLISEKIFKLDSVESGNTVYSISVTNAGTLYSNTDTLTVVSPTVNATARLVTTGGGAVARAILTDPGNGFFNENPTIIANTVAGQNAAFTIAFTDPKQYFRLLDTAIQSNTSATVIDYDTFGRMSITLISGTIQIGDSLYQIGEFGESASALVTNIVSSTLDISQIKGVFNKNKPIYVVGKDTVASFNNLSLNLAVSNVSNTFVDGATILFKYSGTKGIILNQSSGIDANYEVGSITNSETINLNTDLLNGVNTSNTSYMNLRLNSSVFGFPTNPSANLNSIIFSSLTFEPFNVGTINTLSDLNPGLGYNTDPRTLTYQPYITGFNYRDFIFKIGNLDKSFALNEEVLQIYSEFQTTLQLSKVPTLRIGEKVYTANSTFARIANGIVSSVNANTIILTDTVGTILPTQNVYSYSNTAINIPVVSANTQAVDITAKAIVEKASDTELYVKRIQFDNLFKPNLQLIGSRSGANATLLSIEDNISNDVIGINANIFGSADSIEGAISTVRIIDSGFGYKDGQNLIFTSDQNESTGTAIGATSSIGVGIGYYKTSKGFLSSLSKLHDGDFYQEYSYEVFSRIPIDKYSDMFKKVMHTAGTRFFGSLLVDSIIECDTTIVSSSIEISDGSPYVINDRFSNDVEDFNNFDIEIRE